MLKLKNILPLILLPLIFCCGMKFVELTADDEKFILTEKNVFMDLNDYKNNYEKNGRKYMFLKTINRFGLYTMYGVLLLDKNNNSVRLRVNANKFHFAKDIDKLFKSELMMKKIYKDSVQALDLAGFYCDDGFYIKSKDMFVIVLKKDKVLYSVNIEGANEVELDDIREALSIKLGNLALYSL